MESDTTRKQENSTRQKTSEGKYWLRVPARAVAYVTGSCNYACNHCYASTLPKGYLTTQEYEQVFDKLARWGVFETVFLGGEPFSRPDFLDIAEIAVQKNLGTKTSTNASYITKENVQRIKDYFDGKLQVSLDGPDEKTNDAIRGQGSFTKTLKGIENLLEAGVTFSLGFVVNAQNNKYLQGMYDFANKKGIAGIHIIRGMPKGRALESWDKLFIPNDEWVRTVKELRKTMREEDKTKVQIDGTYEYDNNTEPLGKCLSGCEAGRYELTILANGDIVPCDMFHEQVLGNILTTNLQTLWLNDPTLQQFRKSKQNLEGKCGSCEVDFCTGCRYQALTLNGGFNKSDPYCVREEFKNDE